MRALVLGSSGTLGQALCQELPKLGIEIVAGLGRSRCDLSDLSSVEAAILGHRADVVFNAAAFTDVDGAEDAADEAYRVNALAPEAMALACVRLGSKLVHYSTDFVFDGQSERPYDEFDTPAPQGVYARSKLAGERLAASATRRLFLIRVGCLYGRGGRNFPSTMRRRLLAGETLRADEQRRVSPTWVVPVVRASAALARTEHFGLYHCTAQGETSWADYARFLAHALGVDPRGVQALATGAIALKAARPPRAILDNRMLRLRGLDTLESWQDQAREYLASEAKPAAEP